MDLDKTDKKILKFLKTDARLSARQLALKMGMSTVTILSRINHCCNCNCILSYIEKYNEIRLINTSPRLNRTSKS